jgi:DNA-directed RNA polymerase specialized sigma24 family protein
MRGDSLPSFVERVMGASQASNESADIVDHAARTAAFRSLYETHVGEVYQYVHRRCRDRATAEDVTHDVFVSAVRTVDDPASITIA